MGETVDTKRLHILFDTGFKDSNHQELFGQDEQVVL